ncbi:MAG: hypothetical protein AAGD00_08585 [Planctomycetota bacterium]
MNTGFATRRYSLTMLCAAVIGALSAVAAADSPASEASRHIARLSTEGMIAKARSTDRIASFSALDAYLEATAVTLRLRAQSPGLGDLGFEDAGAAHAATDARILTAALHGLGIDARLDVRPDGSGRPAYFLDAGEAPDAVSINFGSSLRGWLDAPLNSTTLRSFGVSWQEVMEEPQFAQIIESIDEDAPVEPEPEPDTRSSLCTVGDQGCSDQQCTVAACTSGNCTNQEGCTLGNCTNNSPCTSGDQCTGGDGCTGGADCTNGGECTGGGFDLHPGCTSGSLCTGGTSCTASGSCTANARACTEHGACTESDACTQGGACTDGTQCTGGEVCTAGWGCSAGASCTFGSCTGKNGCTDAFKCTDRGECTEREGCHTSGNCQPTQTSGGIGIAVTPCVQPVDPSVPVKQPGELLPGDSIASTIGHGTGYVWSELTSGSHTAGCVWFLILAPGMLGLRRKQLS